MNGVVRWICLVGLSACQPGAVVAKASLNGQPSGVVELGEVNLWGFRPFAQLTATITLPPYSKPPVVDFTVGSTAFQPTLASRALADNPREQTLPVIANVMVPVAPLESDFEVGLRLDSTEVAHWTVKRTILDPGVRICTAALPAEVEDESAPLTTCITPTPEEIETSNDTGSRLELPFESTGARVQRRLVISVQRGSVSLTPPSLFTPIVPASEAVVTPTEPRSVSLTLGDFAMLPVERHVIWPKRSRERRSLVDNNPMAVPVSVRKGSSFDVVRDVMMSTAPLTLVGFEEPSGTVSLIDPLPLALPTSVPTGLHVRFAPQDRFAQREFLAVLKFRDEAGLIRTDRIPFVAEGLPEAQCQLAIDEVFVDPIVVGDVKTIDVPVRNLSQNVCENARVFGGEGVSVVASPMPGPGGTEHWRLLYTARTEGPQVELLPVYFDTLRPTRPDLELRVNANPKR